MITLEQLPPKGIKRENAILELGKDEANGELLYQLVEIEKGKCKRLHRKHWHNWNMLLLLLCGLNLSKVNGWAAILCQTHVLIVYRNRSHRSSRKQSPSYWMREIQSRWKSDN